MDILAAIRLDAAMPHASHDVSAAATGRAFLAAIAAGDLATIDALLAPGATWWVQGWGMLGRDALVTGLAGTIGRSTARSIEILRMTAEADRVAIEAVGEFVLAEGVYANSYVYMIVVDGDGRIVEGKEYLDTAVAARFYPAKT